VVEEVQHGVETVGKDVKDLGEKVVKKGKGIFKF
jgi:hypothetical protein